MEFALSEEQELLQETVRGFVANECPAARLRSLFEAGEGHDPALWKGLADMGLAGLAVPEALGGAGLEVLEIALVSEVLGAGALPAAFFGHSLASLAHRPRQAAMPSASAGCPVWPPGRPSRTVAIAEARRAWEPSRWSLAFEKGRLRGEKRFVPHAHVADLLRRRNRGRRIRAGASSAAAGLTLQRVDGLDRTRPLSHISFRDAPAEALPGGREAAPQGSRRRPGAASRRMPLALPRSSSDSPAPTSRTRQQFGFPLAQFQSVKHQLANLATDLEPTRGLWWFAAHAQDHVREKAEHAAAVAKAHVTECAIEVARGAVELHGGIGFTWECDVQFWFKRALFDRTFLGAPAHHRDRSARLAGW